MKPLVTAQELHKKVIPACSKCGSPNIRCDALAGWNEKLQEWKIMELIEGNSVCGKCGQDCDIKWRLT